MRGQDDFTLFGRIVSGSGRTPVGVRSSTGGLEIRVNQVDAGTADLASALPLQVIDPDVHDLVGGGPEGRRRFLDWVAFHVEHDFLTDWRRFRRALRQRNAALKSGHGVSAWTAEFVELGLRVDAHRRKALGLCLDKLVAHSEALLLGRPEFAYQQGWASDKPLADAVRDGVERDMVLGSTQSGPHRADLRLVLEETQARRFVSRGQQKLLACAMIIAATETVQEQAGRRLVLLIDDPAAELDRDSLRRLMARVFSVDAQLFATALERDVLDFPDAPAVFHVEQGVLTAE